MRKVKLLALLLAALMVVAAFAGCADTTEIEGEVDGLESRVEALENAINGVQGSVSDLENSVSGIGSGIADNNAAVQGVLDALKDLESKLNETEKAPETEAPVAGDSVDALKKRADELGAKIGALQAQVMAEQVHYVAADYVDALKALTAAHTEIAASNTVAAMDAVYAALEAKLAALVRVDEKFYNYYTQLKGNYTGDEACLALVEEALDWYEEAEEHYENTTLAPTATSKGWLAYENGEFDKKGEPVVVELNKLKEEMENWDDQLEDVKADAELFVEAIDDIEPDALYADLAVIVGNIAAWKKDAVALAPVHGELVTNYAKLEAALEASLNFTVAQTLIKNMKIESVITGLPVNVFDDYKTILANGSHVKFVVVDAAGEFVKLDDEVIYTADVYANINKAIDKWIDENDITEEVAEYIINAEFGAGVDTFYAKYLNAEKFAASMAAEFEAFKKGAAADILALNSKGLANSEALVAAYQANADKINDWFDASVKAYKDALIAEDKADRTAKNTRVDAVNTSDKYAAVLEANFNEMVVLAGLGKYDETDKEYKFGGVLNYVGGFVADTETTDANYNYIQFYNFKDAEAVTFLSTTYVDAKIAADAINETVAKFPVLQQISVAEVLTAIGGYHKAEKIDTDADATADTDALVVIENDVFAAGTIADYMAKYGKGGSAYATNSKADLSALVDVAAYDKLVAAVFARIDEIDDATSKLNAAYDKLLGTGKEAIITTANTADVAALVAAINAWKNAGGRADAKVTDEYKTVGDYKTYLLSSIVADYEALSLNADFEAVIKKIENRSTAIVTEANLLVSLYKMIDEVNKFSAITFDTLNNTASLKGNFAVTKIAKGSVNEETKNYKWGVTYVTFDAETMTFVTKTNWDLVAAAQKSEANALVDYATAFADKVAAKSLDVKVPLATLKTNLDGKYFNTTELIELATKLYDKFMVDNYGETFAEVETARKNFVAANNGYELKGWITSIAADLTEDGYDISSIKTVTTLAGLTTNLNAASSHLTADVAFGGYKNADLTSDFALVDGTYADLGIADATEYDVDAYIVWKYVAPAVTPVQ